MTDVKRLCIDCMRGYASTCTLARQLQGTLVGTWVGTLLGTWVGTWVGTLVGTF